MRIPGSQQSDSVTAVHLEIRKYLDVVIMTIFKKVHLRRYIINGVFGRREMKLFSNFEKYRHLPITQSAPSSSFPPSSFLQISTRLSTSTQREICFNVRSMQPTFGVPTSESVAVACRFRDDSVT